MFNKRSQGQATQMAKEPETKLVAKPGPPEPKPRPEINIGDTVVFVGVVTNMDIMSDEIHVLGESAPTRIFKSYEVFKPRDIFKVDTDKL